MLVCSCVIRVDGRLALDALKNLVLKSLALDVRNDLRPDLPQFPVQHSHHRSLWTPRDGLVTLLATVGVHLARVRANKALIDFNWTLTAHLSFWTAPKSKPDPMKHEPCCLLGHAK